jgi:hypothetical protein
MAEGAENAMHGRERNAQRRTALRLSTDAHLRISYLLTKEQIRALTEPDENAYTSRSHNAARLPFYHSHIAW